MTMEFEEARMAKALDSLFEEIKTNIIGDTLDSLLEEIKEVLLSKGKQYGHEIQRLTGNKGNVIRLMDKIFRLKNTIIDNPGIADPEDAWLDLLGYSILAVLTSRGYFKGDGEQ